jgi:hypothetical protein
LPSGTYEGRINSVLVGNPWGSGQGAWLEFATVLDSSAVRFTSTLYFDHSVGTAPQPARTEWMRRGAMLGLAQRAFTNGHKVRLVTANVEQSIFVQSIEILKS